MTNTSIVICGEKYDIGTRVVLWDEKDGLSSYDTTKYTVVKTNRHTGKESKKVIGGKRYSSRSKIRKVTRKWVNKYVNQFFLHHSGLYRARDTYGVLHKQRGLSVHFILDDDGTIYQCLDIKEKGWHGGVCNPFSVGIEIDSRASARRFPTAYDAAHQKKYRVGPRKIKVDTIHGNKIRGYEYNDAQYNALIKLIECLCDQIGIPKDFPRNTKGEIVKGVIADPKKFKGLICHYNVTKKKIDPVSLDHARVLMGIRRSTGLKPTLFEDTIDLREWEGRQEALDMLGHNPGQIDGIFGGRTERAIKSFQQEMSLNPTGEWCSLTQTTMMTMLTAQGIIVKV